MASSRPVRAADHRAKTARRPNPGYMGRPHLTHSLTDLDQELVTAAQGVWPAGAEMRQIVEVPPQEFPSWAKYRYGPRHALIFASAGIIHAQTAARGQPAQAHLVLASAIHYVQVGQHLLYGRLEIGYAAGGQARQVVVEFNTVGWDLLQPELAQLLLDVGVVSPPPPVAADAPTVGAWRIGNLPLKFANGVNIYILAPGERLLALAFQPAIWTRRLLMFRSQVTPPILLALTDRHVSLMQEERALGSSPSYGAVITYIPRHGVTRMRSTLAPLGRMVGIEMEVERVEASCEVELTAEVAAAWQAGWRANGGEWIEDLSDEGAGG